MHILFLTDNFPPEGNAPATRTYEHAREWIKEGHKVTVVTGAPNFPEGRVFDGYKNRWLFKERIDGINVWRVKTYITANEGFLKRTLDFISFMLSSFFFGLFSRRVDVVVGTSPQFFTVISAWALAKLKRVPFVFELRDIWPASITAVGAMKESKVIKLLEKIEMFLYRQADLIVSVTHSFKKELVDRGVDGDKIEIVLNGVDLTKYTKAASKDIELSKRFGLDGKFVAAYIGTHGLAHKLDCIVDAARLLKDEEDIEFVFAGGGADRQRIESLVATSGLTNITMIPRQPKEKMPNLWSLCDVSLVTLKNTPLFETVIPSKIFESMGMGIPIVIAVPKGEATRIVEDSRSGIVVSPEDPLELSRAILDVKSKHDLLSENGVIAAKNFDRRELALKILSLIESKVDKN